MSPWCKICGITSEEDAEVVQDAGADALGLVFARQSKRQVSIDKAAEISHSGVVEKISKVGLFVNPSAFEVQAVLKRVALDLLQFQGDEPASFCSQFGLPYIKAVPVSQETNFSRIEQDYADAWAVQLDAHVAGERGGTGQTFDWTLWPDGFGLPTILAGGLNPQNIAEAIKVTSPFGVDVSGGVETIDENGNKIYGNKSHAAIRKFVAQVKID